MGRIKATAIVFDMDFYMGSLSARGNPHAPCTRALEHIRQRLLHQAQNLQDIRGLPSAPPSSWSSVLGFQSNNQTKRTDRPPKAFQIEASMASTLTQFPNSTGLRSHNSWTLT